MDLKRELQIRARVESVFNKREDDFSAKQEFDDYLEEREDIIFNLVEGTEVEEMERKIAAYRAANADDIVRNEARRAEELRQHAAAEAAAGIAALDRAGVSGTAAAFHGGQDAEPHQGMEYTAALPTGAAMGAGPAPLGPVGPTGDIPQAARGEQTQEQWVKMAEASGWSAAMPRKKCLEEAFGSLLLNLGLEKT